MGRAADIAAQNAQLEAQLAASGAGQAGFAAGFGGAGGGSLEVGGFIGDLFTGTISGGEGASFSSGIGNDLLF